jgi:hypothetical protein
MLNQDVHLVSGRSTSVFIESPANRQMTYVGL